MPRTTRTLIASSLLALSCSFSFAAGPAATIDQLSWMTGTYAGKLGANQLEENWIKAEGRSIAAMVRMTTGEGTTSMFEMITIEEVDGSLVLHIQQWNPGFVPRTPAPQKMELSMIADNHVHFTAVTEGGMKSLGYTRNGDSFTIHVENANGNKSDLPLTVRDVWE